MESVLILANIVHCHDNQQLSGLSGTGLGHQMGKCITITVTIDTSDVANDKCDDKKTELI